VVETTLKRELDDPAAEWDRRAERLERQESRSSEWTDPSQDDGAE
jgi:hypothetical protein